MTVTGRRVVLVVVGATCLSANLARATLTPGPFLAAQSWDRSGIASDGKSFFIDSDGDGVAETYPIPPALTGGAFTFALSAGRRFLYSTEGGVAPACAAQVFFHQVVKDSASTGHLQAILLGFCIPNGIAFDGYSDDDPAVARHIAYVVATLQMTDVTQQISWFDLDSPSGANASTSLGPIIEGPVDFPQFSPSATTAFVQRIPQQSSTANYTLVDLCPAALGTNLNPAGGALDDLGPPVPTAAVVDLGGGMFAARVSHPSLAGGELDVSLVDCLAAATTTTTAPTSTTIASTTTTSTTTTTLPPTVTTTDPYAVGGLFDVIDRVNAGQPGPVTFALPGPGPYVIDLNVNQVFVMVPMTIDGTAQSAHGVPQVQIHNGAFQIQAAGCIIRGLAIDSGIFVTPPADGTVIQNNYLGIAPDGVTANAIAGSGIMLGTQTNMILDNVIEGSVIIRGQANVVRGNRIGTSAAGTALVMSSFVEVESSSNVIGGTDTGDGNVVASGVSISSVLPAIASGNIVVGNFVGTDATGMTPLGGSGAGIGINGASNNTIGPKNVVTGAIGIQGGGNNTIKGNLIGTDVTGTRVIIAALAGGYPGPGINVLDSSDNTIGGTMPGDGNVIAGHASAVQGLFTDGILMDGDMRTPSQRNRVLGNFIGTDVTGTIRLPNDVGIDLVNATQDTVIGGAEAGAANLIYFNHGDGVRIVGATASGNTVAGNSIDQNGRGIEVSIGANNSIGPPILTDYAGTSTSTFVGHATGPANQPLTVEFFANPAGDGEGRTFCGRQTYTADASGLVAFSETVACPVTDPSEAATGTATVTDVNGNTSEFSCLVGAVCSTTPGTTPCQSARCILDSALAGSACHGEAVPPGVTKLLAQAERLIEQAADSPPRKAKRLRRQARHLLTLADKAAGKAGRRKKAPLSSACAAEIHAAIVSVRSEIAGP